MPGFMRAVRRGSQEALISGTRIADDLRRLVGVRISGGSSRITCRP
jgi:hypothetical protein